MIKIIKILKDFVREDFNFTLYAYFIGFLIVTITVNYSLDFEHSVLGVYFKQPVSIIFYTVFYAFGYYVIAIPQLLLKKKGSILKDLNYWLRTGIFILIAGFAAFFYWHLDYSSTTNTSHENYFIIKLFIELKPFLTIILPLLIFWIITTKGQSSFYGLKFKGADLRPYFLMLLIMFPLIFWASFQEDFLHTYPIFKPWILDNPFGLSEWQTSAIFEPLYGVSFFSVELLFRGALIIGMVGVLGKEAVLPMVSMYAFLHFGKPLGETIGSVCGGYILGVIALNTRHILGGCIIHIGVAYMMELGALIQHYYIKN